MAESRKIKVSDLRLDAENPRLPLDLQPRAQMNLLRFFAREYSLEEIGESIAKYGYFDEEPLLVVPNPSEGGTFIVVEGNRRLAALKLLTDPSSRKQVRRSNWDDWAAEVTQRDVSSVPCQVYGDRSELDHYLGFRHVSGIVKWSAEAKARFITKLIDEKGYSFYEAGRAIGSRADAIRRQYYAYRALRTAQREGINVSLAEQSFGVWYRALQNPGIRKYAGVRGWTEQIGPREEALESGVRPVEETLEWVFGGGDDGNDPRPVIRDSRELDRLGKVVADPKAVAILKTERSLSAAETMLVTDRANIIGALNNSLRYLVLAIGEADNFIGDIETIQVMERVSDRVQRLRSILQPVGFNAGRG